LPRNLIIVRAGDNSLHTDWLGDSASRNWDIIVNYYGDNPDIFRDQSQKRIDSKGPKWPALHDVVHKHASEIAAYEYVWFPDDDLVSDIDSINRMFDICREYDLSLAQPSLTLDSIIGNPITLTNHAFKLRFTTFIEIMAPVFSQKFLQRCAASFNTNLSGYGLDFLWPTWAETKAKVAIIDDVAVKHTRSRGPQYNALNDAGITPEQELKELILRERIRPLQATLGGIDKNGQLLALWNGEYKKLIQNIIAGYLPELTAQPEHLFKMIEPILDIVSAKT
jgi:hypothetical protein